MEELEPGAVLHGTYRLLAPLGEGGMGTVWRAEHVRLPKQVAVKVLRGRSSGEALIRFRREAEVASRLGHPNIVEVSDFNTLPNGQPYLVMELLSGESLRDRIRRSSLEIEEAFSILYQIGSALEQAHAAGIVHRDLKPENVFLCQMGDGSLITKVLDFGISKVIDDEGFVTQDASVIGTPAYMSPEQACGQNSSLDARSDQFSLGTMAYELLTGKSPFRGKSIPEMVHKIVTLDPPLPSSIRPEIAPEVEASIVRAMSKDRDTRYSSVAEFISDLTGRPLAPKPRGSLPAPRPSAPPTDDGLDRTSVRRTPSELPKWGEAPALEGTEPTSVRKPETQHASDGSRAEDESLVPIGVTPPRTARVPQASNTKIIAASVLGGALVGAVVLVSLPKSREIDAPQGTRMNQPILLDASPAGDANTPDGGAEVIGPTTNISDAAVLSDAEQKHVGAQTVEVPAKAQRPRGPEPETKLSPEAASDLEGARTALAAKQWDEALRLAKRALYPTKSDAAFSVLAIAYCGKRDLGNAKAMLRSMSPRKAASTRDACKKMGMEGLDE